MSVTIDVNPAVLRWARETAGLSLDEAAEKLGLSTSERSSAAQKLAALEEGKQAPTRNQLLKIGTVYRRPIVTFFLRNPPRKGERGEDFRLLPEAPPPRDDALLDALVRDVHARQQLVRSLLEDEEETKLLAFVGSVRTADGFAAVGRIVRAALGIRIAEQRAAANPDQLFSVLRSATERLGVFVLLVGDLGSHHSAISENIFRGFAIADQIAPFIVINDQDARVARSFTLLHELVHIWLGVSAISGGVFVGEDDHGGVIERFCNDVASEILFPSTELERLAGTDFADREAILDITAEVARQWNISQPLVVYRMFRQGWITQQAWSDFATFFRRRWQLEKARQRNERKEEDGGPSYYTVRRSKLGSALVNLVRRTMNENVLTHTKAAKILGVHPSNVKQLLENHVRAA